MKPHPPARRGFLLAFAGLVIALVLASSASAAAPSPFRFDRTWQDLQYPVEQQSPGFFFDKDWSTQGSWVSNPTDCAWDVDDQITLTGSGRLGSGSAASGSLCVIADGYDNYGGDDHMLMLTVTAARPTLQVTLSTPAGTQAVGPPVPDPAGWRWYACLVDHTPGPYLEIPGSNGGTGTIVPYTATVAVPAGARESRPWAVFEAPIVGSSRWFAARKAGCV